ncbi:hypothetical protein ABZX98_29410 [Streptomyces sp. NPDC002992]|uniref:hypothetical protein n=1 Tax=Streptomyces sp. NPDC002992 TaxID=3154273 RepID=UPI0033A22DF5
MAATSARQLLADPGLQRAHVRGIGPRAERLRPAEHATHQLTLDDRDDTLHPLEATLDRACPLRPSVATS